MLPNIILSIVILSASLEGSSSETCTCSCSSIDVCNRPDDGVNSGSQTGGQNGPSPNCPNQTALIETIDSLKTSIKALLANQVNQSTIDNLQSSVNTLQLSVNILQSDVRRVQSSVNGIQSSITNGTLVSSNPSGDSVILPGFDPAVLIFNPNTSFPGDVIYEGILKTHPRDCREIMDAGDSRGDGIYSIYDPAEDRFINVRCGMTCDGGGWLELMRRESGLENFNRTWKDYVNGFGDLTGEFWMGLEYMHKITKQFKEVILRVDLVTMDGDHQFFKHNYFLVNDASTSYTLSLGSYSGSAGNHLYNYGRNQKFTTFDRDHDRSSVNCAVRNGGGWWWYGTSGYCGNVCLTGIIDQQLNSKGRGGITYGSGYSYSGRVYYKSVVMKIRPAFGLP